MEHDLNQAVEELRRLGKAFVLLRDGRVLGTGERTGIGELLALADKLGSDACGAALADRVVGRAAAFAARELELASVHAIVLSEGGRDVLQRAGIGVRAERIVPVIRNRAGDGTCPFELLLSGVDDPIEAMAQLRAFRPGGPPPS